MEIYENQRKSNKINERIHEHLRKTMTINEIQRKSKTNKKGNQRKSMKTNENLRKSTNINEYQ